MNILTRPRGLTTVVGILISALFLYATLATIPFGRLAAVLAEARAEWIAASLGFIILAYILKISRWTMMLRSLGARIGFRAAAAPFLGGVALNNVLPFRAGDLIRVVAFQRFTQIPPSGQLGTLALERLMDLLVLMAILFVTLSLGPIAVLDDAAVALLRVGTIAVCAATLGFIAAPSAIRLITNWAERKLPRFRPAGDALLRLSQALALLSRPMLLLRIASLSLVAWLAEGGAYFAAAKALGIGDHVQLAGLALSVGTLSTLIPSSPGYVGTFHFFTSRAASALGEDLIAATAFAILIHALLWLATTLSGFFLLAVSTLNLPAAAAADRGTQ